MAQAVSLKRKAHEFFSWQCVPGAGQTAEKTAPQLTGLRPVTDQKVGETSALAYEFFVNENGKSQGPVRLLVAKDSGLPVRMEMTDPQGHGSVHMDYTDFNKTTQIEVPDCLSK
jgi:outer membrane lipoprotein-sorting protein